MEKLIRRIDVKQFRNKTHFEFMTGIQTLLASGVITGSPKIAAQADAFSRLLAEEDTAVLQVRKYEESNDIIRMDAARDNTFTGIKALLRVALKHKDDHIRKAAERLKPFFDANGNLARLSLDEETAAIHNLLQELDARPGEVQTVGIAALTEELRGYNGELKTLMESRYTAEAQRSHLKMKEVRKSIDTVYLKLISLLEADAAINDEAPYTDLFAEINARVTRYANIMAQEKGRRKKDNPKNENEESPESPDN
ncbi:MAG: DUF6261 family protein [Bacteroidales bacterium]|jgi:hypothetical protein|nr:DUF6261 family protein [Bacteroidales bacterium]